MKNIHIFITRLKHYLVTELRFFVSSKLRSSIVKVNFGDVSYKLYTNSIFSWIRAKRTQTSKGDKNLINWGSKIKKDCLVLDIGSNFGLLSIYLAKKNINVISIEPDLSNYLLLIQNIKLNKVTGLIKTYPVAINKKDIRYSELIYGFSSANEQITSGRGDSSLLVENNNYKDSYTVASTDLLTLLEDHSQKISHIKIDIEDSIYLIIDDIKMLIKKKIIKSFYIELNKSKKFLNLNDELLQCARDFEYEVLIGDDKSTSTDYILNKI